MSKYKCKELRRRIVLTDGGIYDNMGMEAIFRQKNINTVLVSDACAPFVIEKKPHGILEPIRVINILMDQVQSLRKRWLVADFKEGRQHGAYWGIGTKMKSFYKDNNGIIPDSMIEDSKITDKFCEITTRLKSFDSKLQGQLINWGGYALCDLSLCVRAKLVMEKSTALPVPEVPL
ncbi:hypothetical protein [Candidatus Nitrosacidococcus sp. I8]|uniref:hypothetical protein n=1 Tax=Candidatus Nitrosacidococcus sp. I8 TaxID=2942908 RepID=UPI0022276B22|nr:hypothetical protein [Candidatus Nitrosacidococcus sp. I8]